MIQRAASLRRITWLVGLLSPTVMFAQEITVESEQDLIRIVRNIGNVFAGIVFAVAIIMILVSAWNYMTSGGDAEKVKTAHQTLIWALVGIAVAFFAFVATKLVQDFLK